MKPTLDPGFLPPIEALRAHRRAVERSGRARTLALALERDGGVVSRHEAVVLPEQDPHFGASLGLWERWAQFLVWSRGARKIWIEESDASGVAAAADRIQTAFSKGGRRAFERDLLAKVYGRELTVERVSAADMPAEREDAARVGGHTDGCRIGFDLGASDYKIVAVIDGRAVFTDERAWDPTSQDDPEYHRFHIRTGLQDAAAHLPRVDAIGGSAAGIYIDGRVRVASIFRAVPEAVFAAEVAPMFVDLGAEWGVPVRVINDGDVAALAGAMKLGLSGLLAVAMGSSQAAGYVNGDGNLTGWLNELAFAPIDMNPRAPVDDWSGDLGVGASYFSQRAVARLTERVGMSFDAPVGDAERLALVQEKLAAGDLAAVQVFETIGDYLGYTIPWYAEFYDLRHLMLMGRVTSGAGGEICVRRAREVLAREFPGAAEHVAIHLPADSARRVGQAVAAASLPELGASR